MKSRPRDSEWTFLPAADWVRWLAEEARCFDVVEVLEEKPGLSPGRREPWDRVITVVVKPDDRRLDLLVAARRQLTPQAALGFLRRLRDESATGVPLVCVPHVSPRLGDLCREMGVSYLDSGGNCRIEAPGLLIHVTGRPRRSMATASLADPFSRKSSRIVRLLLTHPDRGWQVQQWAAQADVSLGLASKVKQALLNEAYLEERDRRLYLRDPAGLLQGWAAQYRPRVRRLQLFTLARPAETEARLAAWCQANAISYALTQLAAAWRYAPLVRPDKTVVYLDQKAESETHWKDLLRSLDARAVESGANAHIWLTDDPAVFTDARAVDGVSVVSPLQLYLDLRALAGRGADAAQEILERELSALAVPPVSGGGEEHSPGGRP